MIENILTRLPYFFGAAGIILVLVSLIGLIFGGGKKEGGFNLLSPGIGCIVLSIILYLVNPFLISFLSSLR